MDNNTNNLEYKRYEVARRLSGYMAPEESERLALQLGPQTLDRIIAAKESGFVFSKPGLGDCFEMYGSEAIRIYFIFAESFPEVANRNPGRLFSCAVKSSLNHQREIEAAVDSARYNFNS